MDAIIGVNRWYESLPETRRMLIIPLILIVVGGINMAMTIGHGFPFGLLFGIALLVILVLRAPYAMGYVRDPAGHATAAADDGLPDLAPHRKIDADWLYDANMKYEGLSETTRFMAIPLFLAIVGGFNMALTIHSGFPFGLLFLVGIIVVVGFRLPFEAGWLKKPGEATTTAMTPPVTAPAPAPAATTSTPTTPTPTTATPTTPTPTGTPTAAPPAPVARTADPSPSPEPTGGMLYDAPHPDPAVRHAAAHAPAPDAITDATSPAASPPPLHDPAPAAESASPVVPHAIPPHSD